MKKQEKIFEETSAEAEAYIKTESRRIAAKKLREELETIERRFTEAKPGGLHPQVAAQAQKKLLGVIAKILIAILDPVAAVDPVDPT